METSTAFLLRFIQGINQQFNLMNTQLFWDSRDDTYFIKINSHEAYNTNEFIDTEESFIEEFYNRYPGKGVCIIQQEALDITYNLEEIAVFA